MEGKILGELEGLEAVYDQGFAKEMGAQVQPLEEEAVPTKACEVAGDGGMGCLENTRDLAQPRALGSEGRDGQEEVAPTQPVVSAESGRGEAPPAVGAAITLNTMAVRSAVVEAGAEHSPRGARVMEGTTRIWAAERAEAAGGVGGCSTDALHVRQK